jgi:hypothetical protein
LRLDRIEFGIFREFWRQVHVGIDGVHRAYVYTCHAINAFIGMNDHLGLQFVETGNRTDLYAVGELASVTFFGHDMSHGILVIEG